MGCKYKLNKNQLTINYYCIALDPAGPFFEAFDLAVRVDSTDAKFVDVIHSNGDNILFGNVGMATPCGHVDFYVIHRILIRLRLQA